MKLVPNCETLESVYTWGRIEDWPELSKFEPIGWLNFSKSSPKALYLRTDGTTTCPTCSLRWRSFGAKPYGPREAIRSRFWLAQFLNLGRIGANWSRPFDHTNLHHLLMQSLLFSILVCVC